MKNTIFLLLTLCVLCQCSCKKSLLTNDDDTMTPMTELEKLPLITSEGANTFGCLVNGEAWTPKGFSFPESNFDVYYDKVFFDYLFIQMYNRDSNLPKSQSMTLNIYGLANEQDTVNSVSFRGFENCIDYRYRSIIEKKINISRLDTINKIVSGTFDFVVAIEDDEVCQDTLHITDGRFDAIYRY